MTSEALTQTTPATKPCVRCRVEINAASGQCTLCGAPQQVRGRSTTWLVSGVVVLLIAGIAVAGGLLLGGSGRPAPPYTTYQAGNLVTLIPRGWDGGLVPADPGITRAVFSDPSDPARRMTVTVQRRLQGTAIHRARLIRSAARSLGGFQQHFFGRIYFPGDRPAWRVTYQANGYAHAVYVFSACTPSVGLVVDLRALHQYDLKSLVLHVPVSATARCRR